MYDHKDKLKKALALLSEGKGTREVSKQVGLNFTQLQHIRKLTGLYVDVKAYENKLKKLREEKWAELKRLEHLDELIKRKIKELMAIEGKVNRILSSFKEGVFLSFIEALVAALERVKGCLGEFVGALYSYAVNSERPFLGWMGPQKWEEALKLSKEWRKRLDEAIAFLKEQQGEFADCLY
jgi:DNA repair exonuclease SbcCD ATPase subunit